MSTMFALVSCDSGTEPEVDYSYPVSLTTKGSTPSIMEIYNVRLIKDTEEELYSDTDYFSFYASMIPGKRVGLMYDESFSFSAYIPDVETLKVGQEIVPRRMLCGYLNSNNSGHVVGKMAGGKMVYRGMKNENVLIEFQDVIIKTFPTRHIDDGEHLISGTMECSVFGTWDDYRQSGYYGQTY